ncbi:hypothetical protein [Kitasatospora griseola]|uniref:hypothetical protein n=1 Tax=Kitasatospora griseola TaxID=2064 RepID=UPI00341A31F8
MSPGRESWYFVLMSLEYWTPHPAQPGAAQATAVTLANRVRGFATRTETYEKSYERARGQAITEHGMPAAIYPSVKFWTLEPDDLPQVTPDNPWMYSLTIHLMPKALSDPLSAPTHRTFSGLLHAPTTRFDAYQQVHGRAAAELAPSDGNLPWVANWQLGPDRL